MREKRDTHPLLLSLLQDIVANGPGACCSFITAGSHLTTNHPFHALSALVFLLPLRLLPVMQSSITADKMAALEQRMKALGIREADLLEKFVRGSGAGGQKINKTSNCVFLKHLPTGICIKCQMSRSREMNRFLAKRELCDQFDAIRDGRAVAKTQAIEKMRRTNRPRSRNSKNRSVADKRQLSQKKSMRRSPSGD